MKRSEFLKRLGIGTAAIIATPAILAEKPKETMSIYLGDKKIAECETHELDVDNLEFVSETWSNAIKDCKEWTIEFDGLIEYTPKKLTAYITVSPELL